jgi:hypothetical protein
MNNIYGVLPRRQRTLDNLQYARWQRRCNDYTCLYFLHRAVDLTDFIEVITKISPIMRAIVISCPV